MSDRPNILMIVADQWRFDYLGAAGADWLRTPNLDALAARGALVSHCCTTAPVCVPARIGLASGLYPERLGSTDNNSYLPRRTTTFYERLRDADYYTGVVGKLDLAKPDHYNGANGQRPSVYRWGFTHPIEAEGKMHAGNFPEPIGPYTQDLAARGVLGDFHNDYSVRRSQGWFRASHDSVLPTDLFEDVWIGRQAARWIDQTPGDFPWFLGVHFVGPHDPFDPPTSYAERWREAEVPEATTTDLSDRAGWLQARDAKLTPDQVRQNRRQYAASIECIDDAVGEVLAALERSGQADNTYVVFTADHGEMLGDLGMWTKSVPFDPSARIPLIAAGPGIAPGKRDGLVELSDLNPTICEWAGLPPQLDLDARSAAAFLAGETANHREDCYIALRTFRALRSRDYLFVESSTPSGQGDNAELYHLAADPHATRNVASEAPEQVAEHRRRLRQRVLDGRWCRG